MNSFPSKQDNKTANRRHLLFVATSLADYVGNDELVFIDCSGYSEMFCFVSKKPVRVCESFSSEKIAFIISDRTTTAYDFPDWETVYFSPQLVILGNGRRSKVDIPIRIELDKKNKVLALKIARDSIKHYLSTGKIMISDTANISETEPFKLRCSVAVTLWLNGKKRGVQVVENNFLSLGIIEASSAATRDISYKPLTLAELEQIRIELTIFSPLEIPVAENLNYILADKAYCVRHKKKNGFFYFPSVFNEIELKKANLFFARMMSDATPFFRNIGTSSQVKITTSEVCAFIDGTEKDSEISFTGPVLKKLFPTRVQKEHAGRRTADWMSEIQEEDGNIPAKINVLSGQKIMFDLSGLALAARSLNEFGKISGEKKYIIAANKTFGYIDSLISDNMIYKKLSPLHIAHIGQLAISLDRRDVASDCADLLSVRTWPYFLDANSLAETSDFLCAMSKDDPAWLKLSMKCAMVAEGQFFKFIQKKNKREINPIDFSPLIPAFLNLYLQTKKIEYLNSSRFVASRLLDYQHADGSFQSRRDVFETDSLSTGRIISSLLQLTRCEELSLEERKLYSRAIEKATECLLPMQYDEENTFFVDPKIKKEVIGGIRRSYLNQNIHLSTATYFLKTLTFIGSNAADYANKNQLVTTFPLRGPKRVLYEQLSSGNSPRLFFGKSFKWEERIIKLFWKLFFSLRMDRSKIEALLGSRSKAIRNYSYLLEHLAEKKIISASDIKDIIRFKRIDGFPGFYEALLYPADKRKGIARGFSGDWIHSLEQAVETVLIDRCCAPQSKGKNADSNEQSCFGTGFDKKGAILSGIYKAVERQMADNFCDRPAGELLLIDDHRSDLSAGQKEKINHTEIKIMLVMPASGIPVVITAIRCDKNDTGWALGIGCRADINAAVSLSRERAWSQYYDWQTRGVQAKERLFPRDAENKIKEALDIPSEKKMFIEDIALNYSAKFDNETDELNYVREKIIKQRDGFRLKTRFIKSKLIEKIQYIIAEVAIIKDSK